MYECVQAGENTFFMDCPSRVGVYRDGEAAWLIDSGSDKDAAKKVLKLKPDDESAAQMLSDAQAKLKE